MKLEKTLITFIIIGTTMKFFNVPGHIILLTFSSLTISLIYLIGGYSVFKEKQTKKQNRNLSVLTGFIFSIVPIGVTSKIVHWPGNISILSLGLITSLILLGVIFAKRRKSPEDLQPYYNQIFKRNLIIVILAGIFFLIPATTMIKIQFRHDTQLAERKIIEYLNPDNLELEYYKNGNFKKTINNKTNHIVEYNEDGTVDKKYFLKNGEYDGYFESYHDNGNIAVKSNYREGVYDGKYESYFQKGSIKQKGSLSIKKGKGNEIIYNTVGDTIEKNFFFFDKIKKDWVINESLVFNSNGDTIKERSFYFNVWKIADTINFGEEYNFALKIYAPTDCDSIFILEGDFDENFEIPDSSLYYTAKYIHKEGYISLFSDLKYKFGKNSAKIIIESYHDTLKVDYRVWVHYVKIDYFIKPYPDFNVFD